MYTQRDERGQRGQGGRRQRELEYNMMAQRRREHDVLWDSGGVAAVERGTTTTGGIPYSNDAKSQCFFSLTSFDTT